MKGFDCVTRPLLVRVPLDTSPPHRYNLVEQKLRREFRKADGARPQRRERRIHLPPGPSADLRWTGFRLDWRLDASEGGAEMKQLLAAQSRTGMQLVSLIHRALGGAACRVSPRPAPTGFCGLGVTEPGPHECANRRRGQLTRRVQTREADLWLRLLN